MTTTVLTVFDKVAGLAECLCAQIATEGMTEPCFCGVLAGDTVVNDYIGSCTDTRNGMAYVRLITGAPTTGIGVQDTTLNNCAADLGFDLEVGILRSVNLAPNRDGSPPTPAQQLAWAQTQMNEMEAMRRAIMCCAVLGDFILNEYTPVGPAGGVIGGFWTLSAGLA